MFGLGKTKVPLNEAAALMAQVGLQAFQDPKEQDVAFRQQAVRAGMDGDYFTIEITALEIFVIGAAINRERLEGRMNRELAEKLIGEFLRAIFRRLEEMACAAKLPPGISCEAVIDFIMERGASYAEPTWKSAPRGEIERLFAKFCGLPKSDVLTRIAWSVLVVRGNGHGDFLRSIKLI